MGDVYRAHDSSLGRDVAIKVLPEDLADDPDRLARLKREAHLLAALNHPNVATIHGFEESEGTRFLVMELVKGESLEQRLAGGRLPVDEALDICRQIAEALEAAHEEGIIHRDLKPANVLITPEGRAKVLDFGLAKTVERAPADTDLSHSPTITIAGTETGVILGTAPYMSPEQVRGKPLDKRADIWAFGCVLYEMLAGSRAFNRETVADTLAAILEVDPPWDAVPGDTPAPVRVLLHRCLQKDPKLRLRDIGDAWVEIETTLTGPVSAAPDIATATVQAPRWQGALPWTVAGVAVVALVVALVTWSRTPSQVRRLSVEVQDGTHLWGGASGEAVGGGDRPSRTAFALTPDGNAIVYAATDGTSSQLYLRRLDDFRAIPIAGTEGASSPFLSPDGQQVGFVSGGDIRVVPVRGGGGEAFTVLSDAPFIGRLPFGISWTDDWIVFAGREGIFRVGARGGNAVQLTQSDPGQGEYRHLFPQLLPGGATLLYTAQRLPYDFESADIVALPIGDEPIVLLSDGADARYSRTRHLVFARRGVLMAVGFDSDTLELTSDPVPVVDEVMQAVHSGYGNLGNGSAQFSFSPSGSLAYAAGGIHPELRWPPVWIDREGNKEPFPDPGSNYTFNYAKISPDGRKVVCREIDKWGVDIDITVLDLETRATRSLNLEGRQQDMVWSPDGARIAFASNHEGPDLNLYWIDVDLSGVPQRITETDGSERLSDWSANNMLAFVQGFDIWVVDAEGKTEPEMFVGGPDAEMWPVFSPDGRWLAYASNKGERLEVYVQPYPAGAPEYRISRDGGARPVWSRDGMELFYRTSAKMMAVRITDSSDVFRFEAPRELFERSMVAFTPIRGYEVAQDGRFLMQEHWEHPPQPVTQINIVLNWFEELERLVPTGR